ncbi:MAG: hypothetical protein KJZ87_01010 [Thermoguttaceae bacterium]|nr:hypothetical protein [Thermoguttaceae bacterium]
MSNDPWQNFNSRRCKYLRSKEMFYDDGLPLEERSGSGIFWCSHTHNCLGPDGVIVGDEDCTAGRRCYEA